MGHGTNQCLSVMVTVTDCPTMWYSPLTISCEKRPADYENFATWKERASAAATEARRISAGEGMGFMISVADNLKTATV